MKESGTVRWYRGRGWYARVGALLVALTLVGLTAACSRRPADQQLRQQAVSPAAKERRTAEERALRDLIGRLDTVEGLERAFTRLSDSCDRPDDGSLFENDRSPYALTCRMRADAYFGVRGDIADALRGLRAAGVATWGPQDDQGRDQPYAAGTVTYALTYARDHGRYPDGTTMPAPTLEAPGLRIEWDLPDAKDAPLTGRVEEPAPCPEGGSGAIYRRCSADPEDPAGVEAARARYGTVLSFTLGGRGSSAYDYYTVPRAK